MQHPRLLWSARRAWPDPELALPASCVWHRAFPTRRSPGWRTAKRFTQTDALKCTTGMWKSTCAPRRCCFLFFGPMDDAQTGFRTLTLFRAWIASFVRWKLCLVELFMRQFLQRNKRRLIIQCFTNSVLLDFLFDFLLMTSPVCLCYGILKAKGDTGGGTCQ